MLLSPEGRVPSVSGTWLQLGWVVIDVLAEGAIGCSLEICVCVCVCQPMNMGSSRVCCMRNRAPLYYLRVVSVSRHILFNSTDLDV